MSTIMDDKALTRLVSPRRNRYYYGKLLDALHLTMEQQYGQARRRTFDRLALGPGVVCGLDVVPVSSDGTWGVRITPGLAIDGWGRRIVVPDDVELLPLQLTDSPADPSEPLPSELVIGLCYRECLTDHGPVLVPDPCCDGDQRCEAGTWVETFAVTVTEGARDEVVLGCAEGMLAALRAGDVHGAMCLLAATECAEPPDDPCLALANITVADDGSVDVLACPPREIAPTNRVLLGLITCLAARIEECCDRTPPPVGELRVARMVFLLGGGPREVEFDRPREVPVLETNTEPLGFRVEFSLPPDHGTVTLGSSLDVQRDGTPLTDADLEVTWPGDRELQVVAAGNATLAIGHYRVELQGDGAGAIALPPPPDPPATLDGDLIDGFPSGDGTPGGDLVVEFEVQAP